MRRWFQCDEVSSLHGKLRVEEPIMRDCTTWEDALRRLDPFQTKERANLRPLLDMVMPEGETKLALVEINQRPMFVQFPKSRINEKGQVKLTWDEVYQLGGVPNGSCIRIN